MIKKESQRRKIKTARKKVEDRQTKKQTEGETESKGHAKKGRVEQSAGKERDRKEEDLKKTTIMKYMFHLENR